MAHGSFDSALLEFGGNNLFNLITNSETAKRINRRKTPQVALWKGNLNEDEDYLMDHFFDTGKGKNFRGNHHNILRHA